ncbi:hypothetical protein SDC9_173340 [bioreactor metagenome]|uniref:Uncharacterized protein n=1 Tax=bioreactor metagenome TaxID=1076179 RepID=A0A645GJB9_9ZZZZ
MMVVESFKKNKYVLPVWNLSERFTQLSLSPSFLSPTMEDETVITRADVPSSSMDSPAAVPMTTMSASE